MSKKRKKDGAASDDSSQPSAELASASPGVFRRHRKSSTTTASDAGAMQVGLWLSITSASAVPAQVLHRLSTNFCSFSKLLEMTICVQRILADMKRQPKTACLEVMLIYARIYLIL